MDSQANKSFLRIIKVVRKILPGLAIFLLISVYAVSGIASGMFLSTLMESLGNGGVVLAFSIGGAIQATRGTLVFFPQLNPSRPNFSYAGEVIAIIMGIISIGEILALVSEAHLPSPVGVSLSILMLAGVGVEIFLLREIRFTTEIALFGDKKHWENLQAYYKARKQFKDNLDRLQDEDEVKVVPIAKPEPKEEATAVFTTNILNAIGANNLSAQDMEVIKGLIKRGETEANLISMIVRLGEATADPEAIVIDDLFEGNGRSNGLH